MSFLYLSKRVCVVPTESVVFRHTFSGLGPSETNTTESPVLEPLIGPRKPRPDRWEPSPPSRTFLQILQDTELAHD